MSQQTTGTLATKHKGPRQAGTGAVKGQALGKKVSKVSTASGVKRAVSRGAVSSKTKLSPRTQQGSSDHDNVSKTNMSKTNVSTRTTKKQVAKPYEPIRLPEDILTIQAHSVSTPVTELPYLLIAAHIGSLPTTRQFYPPTSANPTPLTVFRDMFVMTVDVRGFKPSSVRLSTEGQLIMIEGLQSDVPPVVFTQTGTMDTSDKYVMDPTPNLSTMPVHTTFNYVQHRVKLPDEFSDEGLRVGLDDVSGHVVITGRLIHDQKSSFPEPWNKSKVSSSNKRGRRPLVNTSNLSREDARKLAAFHAVQGSEDENSQEIVNTTLLGFGKKQWLEREGAKLRATQHRALRENIRRLTEMKKSMSSKSSKASVAAKSKSASDIHKFENTEQKQQQQQRPETTEAKGTKKNPMTRQQQDSPTSPQDTPGTGTKSKGKPLLSHGSLKIKLNRLASQTEQQAGKIARKKSNIVQQVASNQKIPSTPVKKKSNVKLAEPSQSNRQQQQQLRASMEGRPRWSKVSFKSPTIPDENIEDEAALLLSVENPAAERDSDDILELNNASSPAVVPAPMGVGPGSKSNQEPRFVQDPAKTNYVDTNEGATGKEPSPKQSSHSSRHVSRTNSVVVQQLTRKSTASLNSAGGNKTTSKNKSKDSLPALSVVTTTKETARPQSNGAPEVSAASTSGSDSKSGADQTPEDDPIGKQDKAMWEKLLSYAGVHRKTRHGK